MRRVTGWLGWLGGSTVAADKAVALDTDTLTYTLVLRNDGWQEIASSYFTATFSSDLMPIVGSVRGGASWDPAKSAFVWSGSLAQGQSITFTYQADIVGPLPMGHVISHTAWMGYGSHNIQFDRVVATSVNLPVLSQSSFSVQPATGEVGSLLTYTLRIENTGVADGLVTATNPLPSGLALVPNSLRTSGGTSRVEGQVIIWEVPVAVGDSVTLTYAAVVTAPPGGSVLRNHTMLDDGLGNTMFLDASATIGNSTFLPVVIK
jgi:uncharacterized repeat protein (TIGR01451 family)